MFIVMENLTPAFTENAAINNKLRNISAIDKNEQVSLNIFIRGSRNINYYQISNGQLILVHKYNNKLRINVVDLETYF